MSEVMKFRIQVAIATSSSLSPGALAQWSSHRGHICKLDYTPLHMWMNLVLIKSKLQEVYKKVFGNSFPIPTLLVLSGALCFDGSYKVTISDGGNMQLWLTIILSFKRSVLCDTD